MNYTILFTGHMIDSPGREHPRFPPEKENGVRAAIEAQLTTILSGLKPSGQIIKGIASAACGGDLLFHGLCEKKNIKTEVYLPLPAEQFKKTSVSFAGKTWETRFNHLIETHKIHILSKSGKDLWQEANKWMLEEGCKDGAGKATLIALWDLKAGDGEGGTQQMITAAKEKGVNILVIDIHKIN
jgi:hypothetical protein